MSNTARNYHAHGGSEWVIGGKLTFLPGATVEGADTLFGGLPEAVLIEHTTAYVPDSEATTVAALRGLQWSAGGAARGRNSGFRTGR